ncbi:MAG TPA: type II secretion system F family protein [Trichormus sp.]|jgi:tight adherence protein B
MPVSLIVFGSIVACGLIVMAMTRSQWADELNRLGKHSRRMTEKNHDDGEVNIFLQQRAGYLAKVLALAGLESKYDQMKMSWICTALGVALCFGLGAYLMAPELAVVGFVFGLPVGAGAFVAYLKQLAKKRQAKMTEQLPQILETMASSLRAGSPVMECFRTLSETAPDPIKVEFKRGLVSLQLGKPFRDTMIEMSYRIRTPDFRLLTQAIFISQDVGGNLADVVACIADAIRERFKLRDFLNSLTAQGKATAMFIGCLPYGISLMTYMATPGYMIPFLNNFWARIICVLLIIWELIGFWILMKMTTFEV